MTGAVAAPVQLIKGRVTRRQWRSPLLPLLFAVLLITAPWGCAGKQFSSLRPGLEKGGHYISGVPFFKQEESSCGPAALASVVSYWGGNVSLEQVIAKVYLPQLRGTLPMDMEGYLRQEGFLTSSSSGDLDRLKEVVGKNVPVICLIDLGFSVYRRPHYVTVIGFDDVDAVIIAHDGLQANKVIEYGEFLREWGRAGNWMLIARPGPAHEEGKQ
jgi:ABC-type bacteriocin/lantibiotic exporter with double-glycine peptidase domain